MRSMFHSTRPANDWQASPRERRPATSGLKQAPNPELMKKILSERHRIVPSNYHLIKDMGDRDIRDLSRVIENSIVASMTKGKYRAKKQQQQEQQGDESDEEREKLRKLQKELAGSVKYGISEIDTNLELKKFIIDQNEKKVKVKNRLLFDVKNFMSDLIKIKESSKSKLETKRKRNLINRFSRDAPEAKDASTNIEL